MKLLQELLEILSEAIVEPELTRKAELHHGTQDYFIGVDAFKNALEKSDLPEDVKADVIDEIYKHDLRQLNYTIIYQLCQDAGHEEHLGKIIKLAGFRKH